MEHILWSACVLPDRNPDRLNCLPWSNTIPNEKGKSRPDVVISEKQQLTFGSNVSYGETKNQQGCCSKLCVWAPFVWLLISMSLLALLLSKFMAKESNTLYTFIEFNINVHL